ncbi:MAG: glycosyltransferase family 2 protein [Clostridium sp.]
MSNLNCCIDRVTVDKKKVKIEGWVYKEGYGVPDIKIDGINNFEIKMINRQDVCNNFNGDEKALKSGFFIECEYRKKLSLIFTSSNGQVESKEIDVKAMLCGDSYGKKIKKALKMINSNNVKKVIREVKKNGVKQTYYKSKYKIKDSVTQEITYDEWFRKYKPTEKELEEQRNFKFEYNPKISILIPTYNTKTEFLSKVINSILNQTYSNWELCIADGASTSKETLDMLEDYSKKDDRIKVKYLSKNYMISGNTNEAIKMVTGDFIGLLDHDDLITEDALYEYVKVLNSDRNVEFIYCDEDKIDETEAEYFDPHFKPDFSPDTLRSCNYICHFSVFSKELLKKVGYFNSEFDGSQDYDMILRLTEKAKKVAHIPKVLYHWRVHSGSTAGGMDAKSYAIEAGRRAIEAHIKRIGEKGKVIHGRFNGCYKVEFDILNHDKISIIIPNKDEVNTLKTCINSILNKTTYDNYEIVIVENNSVTDEIFKYYDEISKNSKIKVVKWEKEFNYSAINNFGVKQSNGKYLVFLNNDVEILTENWLQELLMHAQRKETAAVGGKLYYKDDTIQHFGILLGIGGTAEHLGKGLGRYDGGHMGRLFMKIDVSAVTGACLMVKRELFDLVNGFNEELAVAYNDVDLCMKFREKGYLNMVTPYAELYHYESKTRGLDNNEEKMERLYKEMKIFSNKWGENLVDPYYNINFSSKQGNFKLAEK